MANFAGDFSGVYGHTATLFATSTGVTTDANATGVSVDLASNVSNVVTATLVCGNVAGTANPTLTAKMQESTDGSNNWTDITGGAFTAVTTSSQCQDIPIKPTKRYVRSTGTVSGTNPVFEATILVGPYPLRTAPNNDGGWDTAVAPG